LILLHQAEIEIGFNAKDLQDLVEHLFVLSRTDDYLLEQGPLAFQLFDDGSHLYGFRPGAYYGDYFGARHVLSIDREVG
jgi:hypothetical protein